MRMTSPISHDLSIAQTGQTGQSLPKLMQDSESHASLLLDNLVTRQTPEGVELMLMPAGVVPRMGAWLLDLLIRMAILLGLSLLLGVFGLAGKGLLLIGYFLLDWFYPVLFEVFYNGQTLGKKQFGLQVCQDNGTPIRWQASMIRNLLRVADFLPFAFLSAMVSMLFHPSSKRLGDMVAGTLVVYVDEYQVNYNIPSYEAISLPMPLQLDEQQAILAFAERYQDFPKDRQLELASILTPIVPQTAQQRLYHHELIKKMPETVIGYANCIMGSNIGR